MQLIDNIKNEFQQYMSEAKGLPDGSVPLREQAFAEFERLGFPTHKNEEWKYTSFKSISDKTFQSGSALSSNAEKLLKESLLAKIETNRLVFVNGFFSKGLSNIIEQDGGIIISNINSAKKDHQKILEAHLGKYAKIENEALNALNTALMNDGAFVLIPSNKTLKYPVLIVNITDAGEMNVLSQPRNLIVLEKNASLELIEMYYSTGANVSFTNVVTEVYAGENSNLEHYKVQHLPSK